MSKTSYVVIGVVAAVIAGTLIAASRLGGGSSPPRPTRIDGSEAATLLAGIPERGPALGRQDAPVTLVEFADVQCPFCAEWSRSAFPEIVRDYVRPGKVRIVFRGLAFIGPDSEQALKFAYAAGLQNKLWYAIDLFYANQAPENSGWVTDEFLAAVGAAIPSFRLQQALTELSSPLVAAEIRAASESGARLGVRTTPSFAAGRSEGTLKVIPIRSLSADALRPTLDALLAR